MRKRIVALACVLGLVLVPSMGVLAAEPEITGEQPVVTEQVQTEEPTAEEQPEVEPPSDESGELDSAEGVTEEERAGANAEATPNLSASETQESRQAEVYSAQNTPEKAVEPSVSIYKVTDMGGEGVYLQDGEPEKGPNGGTVTWNKADNTLHFDNFTMENIGDVEITIIGDITLIITGNTVIKAKDGNVTISCTDGNMKIQGKEGGKLVVSSNETKIVVPNGSLTIEDANLEVESTKTDGLDKYVDGSYSGGVQGIQTGNFSDGPSTSRGSAIYIKDSNVVTKNTPIMSSYDVNFSGETNVECFMDASTRMPAVFANRVINFDTATGIFKYTGQYGLVARYDIRFNGTNPQGAVTATRFENGNTLLSIGYTLSGCDGTLIMKGAGGSIVRPDGTTDTKPNADHAAGGAQNVSATVSTNKVQTGDMAQSVTWLLLMGAAACGITVAARSKKVNR